VQHERLEGRASLGHDEQPASSATRRECLLDRVATRDQLRVRLHELLGIACVGLRIGATGASIPRSGAVGTAALTPRCSARAATLRRAGAAEAACVAGGPGVFVWLPKAETRALVASRPSILVRAILERLAFSPRARGSVSLRPLAVRPYPE
jgi:hypothetical protein